MNSNPNNGGMEMIQWLSSWLEDDNTKLMYLLCLILIVSILDFLFGSINAKFNEKVQFSSRKAKAGLFQKIGYFIMLVVAIPASMVIPSEVGLSALYILYVSYLAIEFNSFLAHLRLAEDDKQNDLFIDFITRVFNKGGKGK